jgi:hypothetical protein
MKLADLICGTINEGMIKLPAKLHKKLTTEFRQVAISYMRARMEKAAASYSKTDWLSAEAIKAGVEAFDAFFMKQYGLKAGKYNIEQMRTLRTVGDVTVDDLDPSYKKLLLKPPHLPHDELGFKPLKLQMHLMPKGDLQVSSGQFNDEQNIIDLNLATLRTIGWEVYFKAATAMINPDATPGKGEKHMQEILARFGDTLEKIEGTLEHEVSHYMQYKVFARGSAYQVDVTGYASKGSPKGDQAQQRYYSSNVEFDPQIKSSIKEVKVRYGALVRKLKRPVDWKILARYAIGELSMQDTFKELGMTMQEENIGQPLPFFVTLKKVNHDKWKKGVKLFMTELEKVIE